MPYPACSFIVKVVVFCQYCNKQFKNQSSARNEQNNFKCKKQHEIRIYKLLR